ncbi:MULTISPECIES: ornithine carbamoyltransferase [Methylococcus]|jgi:ornithine carbamoyltransferase|uniref:Ornithine carbamoyltransferase n=2 Tax=Methylococcus capsulatus TaxID=414 RepID=OTC_METCA|nr:ornithine carbamoyltransferase [Methylococcus capsulatus]Q606D8.1 RecName: Full=Ornithine carbamoyltransferase; Short=OTCase [Methylococcus capsulatus str. Bath]AAU91943.1 ornithine carbamoyltransferase [Methylococcus capsulatus str. Bath]QXP87303.1 ornithine carbamoyltransferase [Methylococcus capsulatus]QXP91342.1 ornithine carbamoyltransferase [Methylococcus capsulatus]QXP92956.1 ornithine carbamoyltransferase [Methylococcus capsulatus]UQN12303.1 ornithine carbamoyltransferase [Methyloc
MKPRHFVTLRDLSSAEFRALIARAIDLKARKEPYEPLKNKVLGMVFEKSSTRTRVSFEVGMAQFGGSSIFLSPRDTQLGRGEPIEDSARVLSRMVDCIMLRTHAHRTVEIFAEYSRVPVINGLTDRFHPCQLLADMQTYFEHRGDIAGKTVAWIGDGNNMCQTYVHAAGLLDFRLRIACPPGYEPEAELVEAAGKCVEVGHDVRTAVNGADLVVTDVWASMGQESEQTERTGAFRDYQVNAALMALAHADALFMHCLPAHRGEEVSAEVLEGPQSVVWDEAENRLHAQKALLEFLLTA